MEQRQLLPTLAVVDDHALVREGMSILLEQMGFNVIILAEHGEDLLTQLFNRTELPEAILLDLHMPVMNGAETAKMIKKCWPGIKIVGFIFNIDEAATMLGSGADTCLAKDCNLKELKEALLSFLN